MSRAENDEDFQLTVLETELGMLGPQCKTCGGCGYGDVDSTGSPMPCANCDGSGREPDWVEYWREYDERYGIK